MALPQGVCPSQPSLCVRGASSCAKEARELMQRSARRRRRQACWGHGMARPSIRTSRIPRRWQH
eukprot:scaffold620_cov282-Pinguiococcus_pyrenoidosus.AAC.3